jgi:hypothetical protein
MGIASSKPSDLITISINRRADDEATASGIDTGYVVRVTDTRESLSGRDHDVSRHQPVAVPATSEHCVVAPGMDSDG